MKKFANFLDFYSNSLTLWAIWKEAWTPGGLASNFKCTLLNNIEASTTIKDVRDNNTYKVAKLKDGLCWMTENLKIVNKTLTSSDSDVASDFVLPSSSIVGFLNYDIANVYVHETYGGYYTWFAATAGEGTQSKSWGDVSHSICPKGWRLPTSDEYVTLANAYGGNNSDGSTALRANPANFVYGGFYRAGVPDRQGSYGFYWSSSATYDDRSAYGFYLGDNYAEGKDGADKGNGNTVRCVSRQ